MRSSKLSTLLYGYVLLICAWFLAWLFLGDATWWLVALNRVVPYLFLPVPVFLITLLWMHKYTSILLLILPASIFSFLYHPYIAPKFSEANVADSDLTVMSYNILYSNYDYDAISRVILTHDPDLVALQEVLPETMHELQDRLGNVYPYWIHGTNADYGVTAIFSRYPLAGSDVLNLGEDRRAVIVKVEVKHQIITFASVHLRAYGLRWVQPRTKIPQEVVRMTKAQNRQTELLWEKLGDTPGPVIIGCDCNSKETSSSYRMLDQWLDSAAYQVGWQIPGMEWAGARQDTRLQHIDYIWYGGAVEPLAAYELLDNGGSDHYPVLAVFDLR